MEKENALLAMDLVTGVTAVESAAVMLTTSLGRGSLQQLPLLLPLV